MKNAWGNRLGERAERDTHRVSPGANIFATEQRTGSMG